MKLKSLVASLILATSVMAATPSSAAVFSVFDIVRASDADLTAALARATAAGPDGANTATCVQGVITYNKTHPKVDLSVLKPVGPVDAAVEAHLVVKGAIVASGHDLLPQDIKTACGALALELQEDVLKAAAQPALTILGIKL